MLVLPTVDVEAELVCLVGDAVADFGAKHHLVALHVVVHHVLETGLVSHRINQVEVDVLVGGDLDSLVALYEVDEPFDVESLVVGPLLLLSERIEHHFEEEDLARAPHGKSLVVDEVHRAEVFVEDLLIDHILQHGSPGPSGHRKESSERLNRDSEALALPVEAIDLVLVIVVEALVREVLAVALCDVVAVELVSRLGLAVPEEVVMR